MRCAGTELATVNERLRFEIVLSWTSPGLMKCQIFFQPHEPQGVGLGFC